MCGRYIMTADMGMVFVRFGLKDETLPVKPRYNIAPTQQVLAVLDDVRGDTARLEQLFGLAVLPAVRPLRDDLVQLILVRQARFHG